MYKAVEVIDPAVKVVVGLRVTAWLQRLVRKTIRAMQGTRDIDEGKMKGKDSNDPANHACTGLEI